MLTMEIPLQSPPLEFNQLRDLIIEKRDKLPKRLAQVAAFTVQFPDEIAFGTAGTVAKQAAVQTSTLVRFAQALGYNGFSDLQAVFQQRLRDRPSPYDARLQAVNAHKSGPSPARALIEGFSQAAMSSIEKFRERMNPDDLNEAAEILANANTIYLIGLRRSYPVSSYLNYALGTLGIKSVIVGSPSGIDREVLSFSGPHDAALAISFTPYAPAAIEHARQVVSQKTPLVAITDSPFSPLSLSTNLRFEIVENDFEGFRTLAATMTLAAVLAVAVADKRRSSGAADVSSLALDRIAGSRA
jgi:DNA-binding MurR/RpiR family transcriptional regulator